MGSAHIEEWRGDKDTAEINLAKFTVKQPFVCTALEKTDLVTYPMHKTQKASPRTCII